MDIDGNVRWYLDDRNPDERYASFDYCFNYFQASRESGALSSIASTSNLEVSCLQLGFYLASWGMLRGSAELLQKSARYLIPIVEVIARTKECVWKIDVDSYTTENIGRICSLANELRSARPGMSDILVTKIMLGVFGIVPAFDENFRRGCKSAGIVASFGERALRGIAAFYRTNAAVIDAYELATVDFLSGQLTQRKYTRAKIIDMTLFTEGDLQRKRDELVKLRMREASNCGASVS